MEHLYEEIKNKHHQKYRISAAVISSIVFTYLVTVFLLLTNSIIKNNSATDETTVAARFEGKNGLKQVTAKN